MIKLIKSTILLFYWISLYLNLTSFQLSLKYYFVCYVYLSWILGAFWALTKACVWFFVTCCFDSGKNTFSSKYLFFPPLCDVSGFFCWASHALSRTLLVLPHQTSLWFNLASLCHGDMASFISIIFFSNVLLFSCFPHFLCCVVQAVRREDKHGIMNGVVITDCIHTYIYCSSFLLFRFTCETTGHQSITDVLLQW